MAKQAQQPLKDQVLKEFPALGKYRIRLLVDPAKPGAEPTLDIREYVSSQSFEGFTRRGIRITAKSDMDTLREVLLEVAGTR
jgi:hypothetical protein